MAFLVRFFVGFRDRLVGFLGFRFTEDLRLEVPFGGIFAALFSSLLLFSAFHFSIASWALTLPYLPKESLDMPCHHKREAQSQILACDRRAAATTLTYFFSAPTVSVMYHIKMFCSVSQFQMDKPVWPDHRTVRTCEISWFCFTAR